MAEDPSAADRGTEKACYLPTRQPSTRDMALDALPARPDLRRPKRRRSSRGSPKSWTKPLNDTRPPTVVSRASVLPMRRGSRVPRSYGHFFRKVRPTVASEVAPAADSYLGEGSALAKKPARPSPSRNDDGPRQP